MSPLVSKFRALLEPNPDGAPISDQARAMIEQAIAAQEAHEAGKPCVINGAIVFENPELPEPR